jgi:hypothetical protein
VIIGFESFFNALISNLKYFLLRIVWSALAVFRFTN